MQNGMTGGEKTEKQAICLNKAIELTFSLPPSSPFGEATSLVRGRLECVLLVR